MECNPDSVAIFTSVLLRMASKTFSHSFTALTKSITLFYIYIYINLDIIKYFEQLLLIMKKCNQLFYVHYIIVGIKISKC